MSSNAPKRIVSFAPPVTEILSFLGLGDQVTTVPEFFENLPPVTDRQKPEYWFSTGVKRAKSLWADLVLTFSVAQQDLHNRLKENGLNAYHLDIRCLRDAEEAFLLIGKVTGTQDRARQLAGDFAGGLAALREKVPNGGYRPKLYCEEWNKPPTVAGGYWPELMAEAGAHYFPILPREISRPVKIEELVHFDPEIIVFTIYGAGLDFDPEEALKRIGWERLTAVKKRCVFSVDSSLLNQPGPRLIEGVKIIQTIIGETYWGWPLVKSGQIRRVTN